MWILNNFFPPRCLHCAKINRDRSRYLCSSCSELLEMNRLEERCLRCFSSKSPEAGCSFCQERPSPFYRLGAACLNEGAARSLVQLFREGNMPYLAKPIASLMAAWWLAHSLVLPTLIVSFPSSSFASFRRGYNPAALLAKEMGLLLQRPVIHPLKRRNGDFSQSVLKPDQRKMLSSSSFYLSRRRKIRDEEILLVDDLMETGASMRAAAEALQAGFPKTICGVVFCSS